MAIERFYELGHNRPHYLFIKVIEEKENRGLYFTCSENFLERTRTTSYSRLKANLAF
jgi:hypothetical protein